MYQVLKEKMEKLLDIFLTFEEKHRKDVQCSVLDERDGMKMFDFEKFLKIKSNARDVELVLTNLRDHLSSMRISQVFEDLPKTGQLLGRLCAIPEFLSNENICRELIGCLVHFCEQPAPLSPLEVKAKTWAISQLRGLINVPLMREEGIPLCLLGSDRKTLITQNSQQIVLEAQRCIKRKNSFSYEPPRKTARNLTENPVFIVYLLQDPKTQSIAESLCQQMIFHQGCEKSVALLKKLSELSREKALPYRILCLLWLNDLDSLEYELLASVKMLVLENRFITQEVCLQILHSNLGRACADHPQIYSAVNHFLDRILTNTNADWKVVEFIGIFHTAMRQARAGSKSQHLSPLAVFYSPHIRSLINLLQVSPSGLQQNSLISHIKSICSSLHRIQFNRTMNRVEVWKTLIHFPEWCSVCLVNCLYAGKKVLQACVDVILWYKCPTYEENNVKESVLQTVSTFQSLLGKHNLKIEDLEYSLSANQITGEEPFIKPLIGQLFVIFIIVSRSGLLIGQEALTLVCKTEEFDVQLGWLLRTITILTASRESLQNIPSENISGLVKLIEDYKSKLEKKSGKFEVTGTLSDISLVNNQQLMKWSKDILDILSKQLL